MLEVGGLERFVVDLSREQKRAGHHPSLCCIVRGGPLARDAESAGIPVVVIGKTSSKSPRLLLRLTQHLRRRSQRPYRPPEGVSFYEQIQRLGLVEL